LDNSSVYEKEEIFACLENNSGTTRVIFPLDKMSNISTEWTLCWGDGKGTVRRPAHGTTSSRKMTAVAGEFSRCLLPWADSHWRMYCEQWGGAGFICAGFNHY